MSKQALKGTERSISIVRIEECRCLKCDARFMSKSESDRYCARCSLELAEIWGHGRKVQLVKHYQYSK
jgi:hypothetical protein